MTTGLFPRNSASKPPLIASAAMKLSLDIALTAPLGLATTAELSHTSLLLSLLS